MRDTAYRKLDGYIAKTAVRPAEGCKNGFSRQARRAGLTTFRNAQFYASGGGATTALSFDAAFDAIRSTRGSAMLPFMTPVFVGAAPLYVLLGTGEKTNWEAPKMHPLLFLAAAVTRFGVLGLGELVCMRAGRGLDRAEHHTLAQAAYAAAVCFRYCLEPLRAGLVSLSFIAQIPFSLMAAAVAVGTHAVAQACNASLASVSAMGITGRSLRPPNLFAAQK